MKFLLIFSTFLSIALQMAGQDSLQVDPSLYIDWESDSLFKEAEERFHNLENSQNIRLQFVEMGLERAHEDKNDLLISKFASKVAVVYTELGMNKEALQAALKALQFAKKTPGERDDIWSLYRLAEIHSLLQNPGQALVDTREALSLALKRDSLVEIGWAYNQFGEIHRRITQYDSAAHYYQKALETFQKEGHQTGIQFTLQNLGLTYAANSEYDKAFEHFNKSKSINSKSDVLYWLEQGEAMVDIILHTY